MNQLPLTPSQTVGPFFAYSLTARQYGYDFSSLLDGSVATPVVQPNGSMGEPVSVAGRVFDGKGDAVPDAIIELWQADRAGQYRVEPIQYPDQPDSFKGFGRLGTGTTAGFRFAFTTCKPGPTRADEAPHINVILFMRGSLRTLYTRLYFPDEAGANAQDALLNTVPASRRHTLIAQQTDTGRYQFDIHLQGPDETVFFDL